MIKYEIFLDTETLLIKAVAEIIPDVASFVLEIALVLRAAVYNVIQVNFTDDRNFDYDLLFAKANPFFLH